MTVSEALWNGEGGGHLSHAAHSGRLGQHCLAKAPLPPGPGGPHVVRARWGEPGSLACGSFGEGRTGLKAPPG